MVWGHPKWRRRPKWRRHKFYRTQTFTQAWLRKYIVASTTLPDWFTLCDYWSIQNKSWKIAATSKRITWMPHLVILHRVIPHCYHKEQRQGGRKERRTVFVEEVERNQWMIARGDVLQHLTEIDWRCWRGRAWVSSWGVKSGDLTKCEFGSGKVHCTWCVVLEMNVWWRRVRVVVNRTSVLQNK